MMNWVFCCVIQEYFHLKKSFTSGGKKNEEDIY